MEMSAVNNKYNIPTKADYYNQNNTIAGDANSYNYNADNYSNYVSDYSYDPNAIVTDYPTYMEEKPQKSGGSPALALLGVLGAAGIGFGIYKHVNTKGVLKELKNVKDAKTAVEKQLTEKSNALAAKEKEIGEKVKSLELKETELTQAKEKAKVAEDALKEANLEIEKLKKTSKKKRHNKKDDPSEIDAENNTQKECIFKRFKNFIKRVICKEGS